MPDRFFQLVVSAIFFLFSDLFFAQKPTVKGERFNFYDIQKDFYNKPEIKEIEKINLEKRRNPSAKTEDFQKEENARWNQFKRWEYFMEPRVYPTGDFFNPSIAWNNYRTYFKTNFNQKKLSADYTGNWQSLNPVSVNGNGGVGSGRASRIRFHPNDPNTIFLTTGGGGLWKSTDAALTWEPLTDFIGSLGAGDLAIDPVNSNIMYLATGDIDIYYTAGRYQGYSVGMLKTTDGGITWDTTGLSWDLSQTESITRILINSNNSNILLITTSDGIYRSADAGDSWIKIIAGSYRDMAFKPGDPSIVYAVGNDLFYRSTDAGLTFNIISSGLPSSTSINGLAIGVTEDDPNYIYLLAGNNSGGYLGLYRSVDQGLNFSLRSSSPNILGGNTDGSGTSGQTPFTIAIAISPDNKDEVWVGGIHLWKSTNGGASWSIMTDGYAILYGFGVAPYVHVDHHDIQFLPGNSNVIYNANDGGIAKTSDGGISWSDVSNGLNIAQIYRIGTSKIDKNLILQGLQDNNVILNKVSDTYFNAFFGGDGTGCFIDWSDNNYLYGSFQNGNLNRSSDGGETSISIISNINELGDWVTPWMMDPVNSQILYAGFRNLWKSTNRGSNWVRFILPGSIAIIDLKVAPSNSNIIYVVRKNSTIYKTTNGGGDGGSASASTNWSLISSSLPTNQAAITSIEVHNTDPNKIWVTFSGYNDTIKVYKSIDGGTSWQNISNGLPNLPMNTIVYQNGSDDIVYVGSDIGVYYADQNIWQQFSSNLPNVVISELEIHEDSKKLRAATYGRGIWETDLYDVPQPNKYAVEKIKITPNPSSGHFTVSFSSTARENYTIEIRNTIGQLIFIEDINELLGDYSKQFDLSNYSKGMYFITLFDTEKRSISKSIIY